MRIFICFGISALVFIHTSLILFHSALPPFWYPGFYSNGLGAPFWQSLVVLSMACAGYVASWVPAWFALSRTPLFIGLTMVFSVGLVGAYAEYLRRVKVLEFAPDSYVEKPFFRSLQEVPRDFQFFLHAAALKHCKPYAWSYREMDFYELPPNAAVNVLPAEWIERCAIKRSHN